ncbi:hypothetical protein [Paenibacillus segetis]|uniref:Uncharacterized protein n=1 Tax=Paenibacillus segetis TaxID=1325360 RepID=A0ABQ1YU47_9BACL|nr:hypothetical protein [Paenibacillus segetis]GGH38865.1 hypothetical protein GCM10008013_47230 [Paenibacillus segetis]
MKSELSYITDMGHELHLSEESNQYIQEPADIKEGLLKRGLTEDRKVLWSHLMLHSGDIRQPWYDKLLQIREDS